MVNVAIIIGNSQYENLPDLECCSADVVAVGDLVGATQKFEKVHVIEDKNSSDLKDLIRKAVDKDISYGEIFFYFTGHGHQVPDEFFYCATNFDAKRPNETGLSNSELHNLLKAGDADLVVKVIDACSSGQLLVKADGAFMVSEKDGFASIIQIASCLDSQSSLTGDPLSQFTDKFRNAVLRPKSGKVYYSDIISTLRDEFLSNKSQIPHFVTQGTGRDQFVSDAAFLNGIRNRLADELTEPETSSALDLTIPALSLEEKLRLAEDRFTDRPTAENAIETLFAKVREKIEAAKISNECYSYEFVEHSDFEEESTHNFIVKILSREIRPDKYVTAEISKQKRQGSSLDGVMNATRTLRWMMEGDSYAENYDLELNCSINKVQFKATLTPSFRSLRKFELVISCAPSLEYCYVFEMLKSYVLNDWDSYDSRGKELNRGWYKLDWDDGLDGCASSIVLELTDAIHSHVESVISE